MYTFPPFFPAKNVFSISSNLSLLNPKIHINPNFSMALLSYSPEISAVKIIFTPNPNNIATLKTLKMLRNHERAASRARVVARIDVKDPEVHASGLNQNARLYSQFSASVKQETNKSREEEQKQNYYVNIGYAIRTLREDFPELFYRELSFDIYRDDIVFKDPMNNFAGIENYKSIFWALRFHGRILFRALWVDIISVWQPMENVIMMRWTVHGVPRVPWDSHGRFDGTSVYKLDKDGKIFEHRVDNIAINSPPKFQALAVEELIRSVGCPSTPRPTYFEVSLLSAKKD